MLYVLLPHKCFIMKLVINLLLLVAAVFLGYVLYSSIKDPITFSNEKLKREEKVSNRLREIRSAQQIYREISGGAYAKSFDELINTIKNERIPIVSVFGDPDDPNFTGEIRYDTIYKAAIDTARALGINVDSLRYIPFSGGKEFGISADTTTYQKTQVYVVEVTAPYRDFMGKYADERYARYDNTYDPNKTMKFGSMSQPSLSGNWE